MAIDAKALVAVDQVIQGAGLVLGELQKLEVGEVAVGGLALEVKLFPRLAGEQADQAFALVRRQRLQQRVLLVQAEVMHL